MITDGIVHDIPASADLLGFKAPLHVLVTGQEGERDRRVELIEAPRFGIVGKDQTISLRVLDTGDRGEPVDVTVRRDGALVESRQARVGARIDVSVRVDHAGPNVLEVHEPTLPGELTALNNRAVVTVDGVRDKLKVLLVSGEPHQGERMWRNILKSDANVDLVHFTILRPPEKQDGTPINELALIAFPTGELFGSKIGDFDLIIFDRYSNQSILPYAYFENIARYVRNGGALLMAVGPDFSGPDGLYYSPLGALSPVRPDGRVIARLEPVVPPGRQRSRQGHVGDGRGREPAASGAVPRRQRPRRPHAERPDLAVGPRLRERRPLPGPHPPPRPLAHEGARTRGGGPSGDRSRARHSDREAERQRRYVADFGPGAVRGAN